MVLYRIWNEFAAYLARVKAIYRLHKVIKFKKA